MERTPHTALDLAELERRHLAAGIDPQTIPGILKSHVSIRRKTQQSIANDKDRPQAERDEARIQVRICDQQALTLNMTKLELKPPRQFAVNDHDDGSATILRLAGGSETLVSNLGTRGVSEIALSSPVAITGSSERKAPPTPTTPQRSGGDRMAKLEASLEMKR